MVKTGFKQITQALLLETFVEAHVCRKHFAHLTPSLSLSSVYLSLCPSVCHAHSCICIPVYNHLYIYACTCVYL